MLNHFPKIHFLQVLTIAVTGLVTTAAHATVLYDGAAGTTPSSQGWAYLTNPFFGADATQNAAGGVTTLDTSTDRSESAGYFNSSNTLSRNPGFELNFDLRIVSEGHNSPRDDNGDGVDDRAGFSVIFITDDLLGLELGFWDDEVWAYDDDSLNAADLFTHAEGAAFDTTDHLTGYSLQVQNLSYTLLADGNPLLTGLLRDYSSFSGSPDPYEIPNLLFFGDDTSSADSVAEIGFIELNNNPAVPVPASIVLMMLGLFGLWRHKGSS